MVGPACEDFPALADFFLLIHKECVCFSIFYFNVTSLFTTLSVLSLPSRCSYGLQQQ